MSSAQVPPSKNPPKASGSSGPLFPLGQIVATRSVMSHLVRSSIGPAPYLARHTRGDWGLVPAEDTKTNDLAVEHGWRILSAYEVVLSRGEWSRCSPLVFSGTVSTVNTHRRGR